MAITYTGPVTLLTASRAYPWYGQTNASLRFKAKISGIPTHATRLFLVGRQFYRSFAILLIGAGAAPNTVRFRAYVTNSSGSTFNRIYEVPIDEVFEFCLTHENGLQRGYLDGIGTTISTFSGLQATGAAMMGPGVDGTGPGAGCVVTLDDLCIWDGYTLSPTEPRDMRDGADPSTIGVSATTRYRWTYEIPAGKSPGDPVAVDGNGNILASETGLRESYGTGFHFLTRSGAGTSVYADPLQWVPSVECEAHIGSSGRTLFVLPKTINGGFAAPPTTLVDEPTLKINGLPVAIEPVATTSEHEFAMFKIAETAIEPGDEVTLDASTGWLTTTRGVASEETGLVVSNRTGQPCYATEDVAKTLRFGINIEYFPTGSNSLSPFMKNRARSLDGFTVGVLTWDANGKPLTLVNTSASTKLYANNVSDLSNGIDVTGYPGPVGLFAVGWDDLNPGVPTTFALSAANSSTTTVTERTDLANPGTGGIGKVRVFDIQRKAGSPDVTTAINIVVSNSARAPQFDNLIINGPGDFSYSDNTPTVLDNSDPWALSSRFLARIQGAGSLRCWYNLIVGNASSLSEIEHCRTLDDFSWGWTTSRASATLGYTRADPFSVADTPYWYSPVMGEKFNATLANSIDASITTLTISDAATAPVIIGLRLYIGSEIMRVTSVAGTTVTVIRGCEDTTPASHTAGTIQVGNRLAMPPLDPNDNGGRVKFTTESPHRISSGTSLGFSGTDWPVFTYTHGGSGRPTNYGAMAMVTGPNTVVVKLGPYTDPVDGHVYVEGTLTQSYDLTPANQFSTVRQPGGPQIPYAMAAKMANEVGAPNRFLAIPHMATNDLVRWIARQYRDHSTPGGKIWVELSNETWNFPIPKWFFQNLTKILYPGQYSLSSYLERSAEVWAIFREIFAETGRADEILGYLNVQPVNLFGSPLLTRAAARGIRVDGLAIAPYINSGTNWFPSVLTPIWETLDVDQAIDLWIHSQWHNTGNLNVRAFAQMWLGKITEYNSATGNNCQLISYEGGIELVFPSSGANWNERNRDFVYSPVFRHAEADWYLLVQQSGFKLFNVFDHANDWYQGHYTWGFYHHQDQLAGKGDGSDGLADNRLCLAEPGLPHSKDSTTNQDLANVSVRGRTWLDWNNGQTAQMFCLRVVRVVA